jgi:hypothetical protein
MVSRIGPITSGLAGANLRDYEIQAAAELGQCAGAQSFRAVRRSDAMPVLLHKFRPARSLLDLGPMVDSLEPPDFTKPFMTRFTDMFAVAGSAYLVEPLPVCFSLSDAWRYVLLNRPHQAHTITTTLARHLLLLVQELTGQGRCDGVLSVENVVLTPVGSFGILAAGIKCEEGVLWLRKDPQEPRACDHASLAEVLRSLLDIEEEIAGLRNASVLLSPEMREGILFLARAVEQSGCRAKT